MTGMIPECLRIQKWSVNLVRLLMISKFKVLELDHQIILSSAKMHFHGNYGEKCKRMTVVNASSSQKQSSILHFFRVVSSPSFWYTILHGR